MQPRSASSPPSVSDLAWSLASLRAAPSWREHFGELLGGDVATEPSSGRRDHLLRTVQIGHFAAGLPVGFEFFDGRLARLGITSRLDLHAAEAYRLADALSAGGVRIPGASLRLRAVGWQGCVFFMLEPAAGDEPLLPVDWLTGCELDGDHPLRPQWIGRQRLEFEQRVPAERHSARAPWLDDLDWSRYERRAFGWKLIDSPALPESFSGPPE